MDWMYGIFVTIILTYLGPSAAQPCLTLDNYTALINGKCFKALGSYAKWQEAQDLCRRDFYNGTLAEPINDFEILELVKLVQSSRFYSVWLGVSDLDQEGHYVRSSDHTTFFTALWGRDQPDNIFHPVYNDDEDCLTLKTVAISEKYITDDECIFNRLYVCQSDPCDNYWPGSRYGNGTCYKYFNTEMSWTEAETFCHSINATLAEPTTNEVKEYLKMYLYNTSVWTGSITTNCYMSYRLYISNNTVLTEYVGGSCRKLLWVNYRNSSSWEARNSQESHAFVCQKEKDVVRDLDPRLYVAALPRLSRAGTQQGLLQMTSNFNDRVVVWFKVSFNVSSAHITKLPLAPRTAVNLYFNESGLGHSSSVYSQYIEINSSQPVTIILYIMDQTAMSSTLLYPSFMYSSTRPTSHNFPSTKDKSTSLAITSMATGINNITVILNVQEQSSLVSLGTSPIMFGSVDTITASLESLHQSLNINQRSNLNGTYLYATTPALVTLGTLGSRTDQMDIDSTLDIILPLASIGEDYFLFPTDIDTASTETTIQCQAVFDWTYVIIPIVEPISFLLPSTGDIHQQSLNNRNFYRIYGNASFYVYQISTRLSGGHLDTCMTSLLPLSLWRDEYDIAKVPDAYAVNIYIIAEATLPLDLVTNDTSLEWTCQSIPGSNYSGCSTRLPSEVAYLHLQLKDKKVKFGAYLLGQGDTSVFCHSVGVLDMAISSNDLIFPHEIYLQRLRNRHKDSCDNTLTTEQTVTSTEVTNQDTSYHNSSISQDVTTIVPESLTEVTADPTSSSSSSSVTTSPAKNTLATSTPDIHEKTEAIVSFLKEDYQGLSSYKRARISVPDTRISSQVIGGTGIAFLTCALVLLSYSDIISLIRFIILLIKKEK